MQHKKRLVFFLIKVIIEFKMKATANISQIKETKKNMKVGRQEEIGFWKNISLSFI